MRWLKLARGRRDPRAGGVVGRHRIRSSMPSGAVDPVALVAALAITAVTTLCCAWRWQRVASGLGVDVPLRTAVAAYYRSQFLNSTLPGGVLGDVHRAFRHGVGGVAAERTVGQVVQVGRHRCRPAGRTVPAGRGGRRLGGRGRCRAVAGRRRHLAASSASGHVAGLPRRGRAVGTDASLTELVPLALVVLLAAAIPLNVAGWGPREGAAAWAFAGAGLGASQGATVAVAYGVLALVATLPGAVLISREVVARG